VVTDIEMPRLDGFGLLNALKRDSKLSDIPVILLTSRDNPQDRQRGLDLGAHSYIVKQKFDQSNLLETIRQVL
jgi:two-component system chemotaxis sensor kinase CheA